MHRNTTPPLLKLALAMSLCGSALAQTPIFDPSQAEPLEGHGFTLADEFGPLSAGQLTPDGLLDVVTTRNDVALMGYSVGVYNGWIRLHDNAACVSILPAELGGLDTAVVGTALGIEFLDLDLNLSTPDFARTLLADASLAWIHSQPTFASARQVVPCDLDASGSMDLVFLEGDGLCVSVIWDVRTAPTAERLFCHWKEIQELVALNYDGGAQREFFVRCNDRMQVLRDDGTVALNLNGVGGAMAVFRQAGFAHDRVACALQMGSNTAIGFVDNAGLSTLNLGAVDVSSISSGDFDLDSRGDLLVTLRGTRQVLRLTNETTGFNLGSGYDAYVVGTANPQTILDDTQGLVVDLDLDGDKDIFLLREGVPEWIRFPNREESAEVRRPDIPGGTYTYENGQDSLHFDVALSAFHPSQYDTLQCTFWVQTDETQDHIEHIAEENHLLPFTVTPGGTVTVTAPLGITPADGVIVHADLRFVEVDSSGAVVNPSVTHTMSFSCDAPVERLQGASAPIQFLFVDHHDAINDDINGGGDPSVTTVDDSELPCFIDDDCPPDPKPPAMPGGI